MIFSDRTSFSGDKNNEYWNDILLKREIVCDGRSCYEFNVTLTSCPERSTFDENDLSRTLISNAIKFGVGLNVELVDYQKPKRLLIKFKYLPHIEIYRARDNDASALNEAINFPRSNKEATLVSTLVKELQQSKGDSFAYVEILMKYYQQRTIAAKKEIATLTKKLHGKNKADCTVDANFEETLIRDALTNELDDSVIRKFAQSVDKVYEDPMRAIPSDYTFATEYLVKPQFVDTFYHEF